MLARNGNPSYNYEIHIGASPEDVWRGLTDGEMTRQYVYATKFCSQLSKGSRYAYVNLLGNHAVDGEILEATPARRLMITWSAHWDESVDKDPPSRVTFDLEALNPSTTRLCLRHDQFSEETATYAGSVASWPSMLSSLKTLLESGKPLAVS